MSYSNPVERHYGISGHNFTTAATRVIKPPPRCNRGRITDIHVSVTTTFTAVTTQGFVNVGTAADPVKYASMGMGTAASGSAYNTRDFPSAIKTDIDLSRDGVSVIQYAIVAPTGGSPAGAGDVSVSIAWS